MSAVSPKVPSGSRLLGRERERDVLDRRARRRAGVLVMQGEPGVGETALLEYAAEAGREFSDRPDVRGRGAEMELPCAAVQHLCSPFFELMERLPQPQHEALGVVFGLSTGPAPNPFLVGLAVLGLLAEAAEEQPLLCVVDDAQVWPASERLGIPESAARTGESEELLVLSPRVVFRHPLVRSAVYGAAGLNERREVHRARAEATDPEIDPDRRAWHRAQAAATPDEDVAAERERSAARAQARGGFAAAAAFLERAVALTPEPARTARAAGDG